jgi:hypothetical protein
MTPEKTRTYLNNVSKKTGLAMSVKRDIFLLNAQKLKSLTT